MEDQVRARGHPCLCLGILLVAEQHSMLKSLMHGELCWFWSSVKKKKGPTIYFIWAEQVQKYGYYTQNKIYNTCTHISAQQNIASIYKI